MSQANRGGLSKSDAALQPEGGSGDDSPTIPALTGSLHNLVRRWVPVALAGYWLVLFTATHVPIPATLMDNGKDKIQHFLGYGTLAVLLTLTLRVRGWASWTRIVLATIAICMLYGAFDELTQPFVNRSCDITDWFADSLGALVAASLTAWLCWRVLPVVATSRE